MAVVLLIVWLIRWAMSIFTFWLCFRLLSSGHSGVMSVAAIALGLWLNPTVYQRLERLLIKLVGHKTVSRIGYSSVTLFGLIVLTQVNDKTVAYSTFVRIFYGIAGVSFVAVGLQAMLETFGKTMPPRKLPKSHR
jgi:hypothetical protein